MARWFACLLLLSTARAEVEFQESLAWVPPLGGAWTLALGMEGRISGIQVPGENPWPTRGARLDVGYLRYLEPHGKWSLGPTLAAAYGLPDRLHPDARYTHLSVGGLLRLRGHDPRFVTASMGLHVEGGPIFSTEGTGLRAAVSAEVLGIGLLWYLSPHLFGELVPWLGVESLTVGERQDLFLGGGIRLRIDVTHRREDDP